MPVEEHADGTLLRSRQFWAEWRPNQDGGLFFSNSHEATSLLLFFLFYFLSFSFPRFTW